MFYSSPNGNKAYFSIPASPCSSLPEYYSTCTACPASLPEVLVSRLTHTFSYYLIYHPLLRVWYYFLLFYYICGKTTTTRS
jgi:hypothetical protein